MIELMQKTTKSLYCKNIGKGHKMILYARLDDYK